MSIELVNICKFFWSEKMETKNPEGIIKGVVFIMRGSLYSNGS